MTSKDRTTARRVTMTNVRVESIRTDHPDVSVVLDFAMRLQDLYDRGLLSAREKVSGDLNFMYVVSSKTENDIDLLDMPVAEKPQPKPLRKTPAATEN